MEKTPPPYATVDQGTPAGHATGYDQYPAPPQAGYAPPPPGYAQPPPAGYAPPPAGYAPPPAGYAPPPQGYYPPPAQQQMSSNVVVVNSGQPASNTVIIQEKGVNHCLHCCISIFFFPWIIVWIILCITN
ncbi:hypothetical protein EGW08_020238 [Elysia chlorotica]|uniref:Uncharacterized protein n=1 Tax=Elysia chlorotica TaxID=188477 RepID=A0A3S0ZCT2_ELYCH|nr:hypothetical protein EGW08_020238 [Elysia chlorotica]